MEHLVQLPHRLSKSGIGESSANTSALPLHCNYTDRTQIIIAVCPVIKCRYYHNPAGLVNNGGTAVPRRSYSPCIVIHTGDLNKLYSSRSPKHLKTSGTHSSLDTFCRKERIHIRFGKSYPTYS